MGGLPLLKERCYHLFNERGVFTWELKWLQPPCLYKRGERLTKETPSPSTPPPPSRASLGEALPAGNSSPYPSPRRCAAGIDPIYFSLLLAGSRRRRRHRAVRVQASGGTARLQCWSDRTSPTTSPSCVEINVQRACSSRVWWPTLPVTSIF